MNIQMEIQGVINKFHKKVESDNDFRMKIINIQKSLNLDLGDETYQIKIKDAKIYYFKPGLLDNADITVTTTPENLYGLISGTLRPMRAYVLKKILVKGKIDDILLLNKLF